VLFLLGVAVLLRHEPLRARNLALDARVVVAQLRAVALRVPQLIQLHVYPRLQPPVRAVRKRGQLHAVAEDFPVWPIQFKNVILLKKWTFQKSIGALK
jgi:hypothetical protein